MQGYEYQGTCDDCGCDLSAPSPPGRDELFVCPRCDHARAVVAKAKAGECPAKQDAVAVISWWVYRNMDGNAACAFLYDVANDTGMSVCRVRDLLRDPERKWTYSAKQGKGFKVVVKEG